MIELMQDVIFIFIRNEKKTHKMRDTTEKFVYKAKMLWKVNNLFWLTLAELDVSGLSLLQQVDITTPYKKLYAA